jgi:DNA ligase (NAD+)
MDKISKLENDILYHKDLYYQGRPEISDEAFDSMENELRKIKPDSFALTVIGSKNVSSKKIAHSRKMLSLDKTYSLEELLEWSKNQPLVAIQKIDGVSCSLVFERGILKIAKTRGDGEFGEDIAENCYWINSIKKNIESSFSGEIRGEIYCSYSKFSKLKEHMRNAGMDEPSSPRNITAGLLGRKDHINLCR